MVDIPRMLKNQDNSYGYSVSGFLQMPVHVKNERNTGLVRQFFQSSLPLAGCWNTNEFQNMYVNGFFYIVSMSLIIITPEITHPAEIDLIHAFFENGLVKLHVRKPFFSATDYRGFLYQIDQKFHPRISIHDHFELLKTFPGLGLHLRSRARENEKIIHSIGSLSPATISTSFHSWNEIEKNQYPFDYVFISPVFDSISKKGYSANINLPEIKVVKQKIALQNKKQPRIIALGGVDATNIGSLYQNGFDGAAVLGAVWESGNPLGSFLKLKETITALGGA